jgi:xanthine dehydrogenase large subunit
MSMQQNDSLVRRDEPVAVRGVGEAEARSEGPRTPLRRPLPHESALGHVTGEACYVDDLPTPPGTLHGMVLSSPHACARIASADARRALEVPGVDAVLFARDLPAANQVGPVVHDEPLLADGEVHCVGQHVAVVFAETR